MCVGAIIQLSIPLSLPHSAALPSLGGNILAIHGTSAYRLEWLSNVTIHLPISRWGNSSQVSQFFHFLKQKNVCYILKKIIIIIYKLVWNGLKEIPVWVPSPYLSWSGHMIPRICLGYLDKKNQDAQRVWCACSYCYASNCLDVELAIVWAVTMSEVLHTACLEWSICLEYSLFQNAVCLSQLSVWRGGSCRDAVSQCSSMMWSLAQVFSSSEASQPHEMGSPSLPVITIPYLPQFWTIHWESHKGRQPFILPLRVSHSRLSSSHCTSSQDWRLLNNCQPNSSLLHLYLQIARACMRVINRIPQREYRHQH